MENSEKIREQRKIFADFDKKDDNLMFEEHFNGIQNEYSNTSDTAIGSFLPESS